MFYACKRNLSNSLFIFSNPFLIVDNNMYYKPVCYLTMIW